MARGRIKPIIFSFQPEPDPRPSGSVRFADPSTVEMTRKINTFNEPYSRRSVGEQSGLRSIGRFANPESLYTEYNDKRGVTNEEEE